MSSEPGGSGKASQSGKGSTDAAKMEALLDQLRNKHNTLRSNQSDSWSEFARQIRMASLDLSKQFRDPAVIHESLEKLQSVMTTNSLTQILERLNSACQKLGLKYSEQGTTVYISTDLFYIDLLCDRTPTNQSVRDVRVAHHGSQPTSVPAMTQALRQGNVQLFMDHIKGFMDMYNVDSESSVKTKFFIVQQSLETDIEKINKVQLSQLKSSNLGAHIYKLWLGLVQPRNGGLPTKLTFWITPYDFLNEKQQTSHPITIESIKNLDLGVSATIGIEQRTTKHQLQTIPLMNYTRTADNRLGTQFVQTTNINSVLMPAAFILKFKKPIALSQAVIKQIERLQGACTFSEGLTYMPMLDAIVKSSGASMPEGTNRFTVALPGQVQNYYINEMKTNEERTMGALVSKLPFTHPTFIIQTIALLRQQLMLNTMIMSCVRSSKGVKAETKPINMELKIVHTRLLTVTFKHPFNDSICTVDIDISDVSMPKCSIYASGGEICSNNLASKAIQRCFSIPITMRAILKQAGHQEENLPPPSKKVKADYGDIMQKLTDHYTARGHYVPYGSVNTASTSCTKNIQTNQYRLCMRRFSGYKRSCFTTLTPRNAQPSTSPNKTQSLFGSGATVVGIHTIPSQAADKSLINSTPMLSSLLDEGNPDKAHKSSDPAHPLVLEPTQGDTPQQAPLLTELLEGPEGLNAEKRLKKIRQKRRTTSETSMSPGSAGTTPTTMAAARKRKKSDNEEIVRELTSKVKMEATEQQQVNSIISHSQPSANISPVVRIKTDLPPHIASTAGQSLVKSNTTLTKPSMSSSSVNASSHDSALVQLLTDVSTDRKHKHIIKTEVVTVADLFDSPKQMKQEAMNVESKSTQIQKSGKVGRPRKSEDERKYTKQTSSEGGAAPRQKKMKKTESSESLKLSKSVDGATLTARSSGEKPKMKSQMKGESLPSLGIKSEDRASPKEKMKKQSSEKEKKKKAPKSPSSSDLPGKGAAKPSTQDLMKLGFYGANNLKSLPKIPKRKPGESQPSPTSPTPPVVTHKSPVPTEWQRVSPVPNRSASFKPAEDQVNASINRNKSYTQSAPLEMPPNKKPLLPTPRMPPIDVDSNNPAAILKRKNSLNDVIHRLSQPGPAPYSSSNPGTSGFVQYKAGTDSQKILEPSPNSPDEFSIVESNPVRVPLIQTADHEIAAPASPTPEAITQAPKSIPLAPTPKPILVKQKAVSRPLTFSPNPRSERLDDDLMDLALGCN